jgi:XTP/dITP diphosphohydrolase
MIEVVLATKNPDKIPEIEAVLGELLPELVVIRGLGWPDVDETGETLEENALLKARAAMEATGYPAIGDDTGLEVDALDGAPGIHTARFAGPEASYGENRAALLEALQGTDNRVARFRTAVAFVSPLGSVVVASGEVVGTITRQERGDCGFGYDCIFQVGDGPTMAEMGREAKNAISHRSRALAALVEALRGDELL